MNWTMLRHSFTATVDTIQNNAFKDLESFLNTEIFGPAGPTKQFHGESQSSPLQLFYIHI